MKLAKYRHPNGSVGVGLIEDFVAGAAEAGRRASTTAWPIFSSRTIRPRSSEFLADPTHRISLGKVQLLPPIDQQEVWAAGVTYRRSQAARMEESTVAGDLLRPGLPVAASRAVLQGDARIASWDRASRSACARTRSGPCPNRN